MIRLDWKVEGDWHIITSPDLAEFVVASTDVAKAFADAPVVFRQLQELNMKPTGYSPTHYLRFAVPPQATTKPARLQQLWRSIYVGEPDEWRDVETVVVQPESTGNPSHD